MNVFTGIRHLTPRVAAYAVAVAAIVYVYAPAAHARREPASSFVSYSVRPTDTLYDVADRYLRDPREWVVLQRLNGVVDPRALRAYVTLRIPVSLLRQTLVSADVIAVSGDVEQAFNSGPWVPLKEGAALSEGDRIQTGNQSFASLELPNGSHIVLPSNSVIAIKRLRTTVLTGVIDREFELRQGRVDTQVTHLQRPRDTFEIISPSAVAGVRGTQFRVAYFADRRTTGVEVIEGTVGVQGTQTGAAPGRALIPAGFGGLVGANENAAVPIALLPAPALRQPGKLQDGTDVAFDIDPEPGALAYRAQIAADAGFLDILRDDRVRTPHAVFSDVPGGMYFVRVSAIDANGLEGLARVYAFERRKNILSGSSERVAGSDGFVFRWFHTRSQTPTRYRFVLANTPDFHAPVIDLPDLANPRVVVSKLPPGQYYWKVIAEQFEDGRFYPKESATQSFTLER